LKGRQPPDKGLILGSFGGTPRGGIDDRQAQGVSPPRTVSVSASSGTTSKMIPTNVATAVTFMMKPSQAGE